MSKRSAAVIDEEKLIKAYEAYQKDKSSYQKYHMSNCLLYKMCKDNPKHDDKDIIVSKVLLIGRAYAVAIERRKKGENDAPDNDSFYYDKVVNCFLADESFDDMVSKLSVIPVSYDQDDTIKKVLSLHRRLLDMCESITRIKKHSFASKYLHFHCRDNVLIYDSRAKAAIQKLVPGAVTIKKEWGECYDMEYAVFFARVIKMVNVIMKSKEVTSLPNPRDIDNFLLYYNQ